MATLAEILANNGLASQQPGMPNAPQPVVTQPAPFVNLSAQNGQAAAPVVLDTGVKDKSPYQQNALANMYLNSPSIPVTGPWTMAGGLAEALTGHITTKRRNEALGAGLAVFDATMAETGGDFHMAAQAASASVPDFAKADFYPMLDTHWRSAYPEYEEAIGNRFGFGALTQTHGRSGQTNVLIQPPKEPAQSAPDTNYKDFVGYTWVPNENEIGGTLVGTWENRQGAQITKPAPEAEQKIATLEYSPDYVVMQNLIDPDNPTGPIKYRPPGTPAVDLLNPNLPEGVDPTGLDGLVSGGLYRAAALFGFHRNDDANKILNKQEVDNIVRATAQLHITGQRDTFSELQIWIDALQIGMGPGDTIQQAQNGLNWLYTRLVGAQEGFARDATDSSLSIQQRVRAREKFHTAGELMGRIKWGDAAATEPPPDLNDDEVVELDENLNPVQPTVNEEPLEPLTPTVEPALPTTPAPEPQPTPEDLVEWRRGAGGQLQSLFDRSSVLTGDQAQRFNEEITALVGRVSAATVDDMNDVAAELETFMRQWNTILTPQPVR